MSRQSSSHLVDSFLRDPETSVELMLLDIYAGDLSVNEFFLPIVENATPHSGLGITFLEWLASRSHWDCVIDLVKALEARCGLVGSSVSEDQKSKLRSIYSTLLLVAAARNQPSVVPVLLGAGANPNSKVVLEGKHVGKRALDLAIGHGSLAMVKDLVDAGAEPLLKVSANKYMAIVLS